MTASLLPWDAARAEAHRVGTLLSGAPTTLDLVAALGRTIAADLRAPGDVPGHDGAAMDGWAVAGDPPWRLGAAIVAGSAPSTATLEPGQARPVTTGAAVPPGTTAVVRSEDARVDPAGRLVRDVPPSRRHIRPAGEEVRRGDLLFPAGDVLTPPRAALAAASGVDQVSVVTAPTVRVAVLGDEVVGAGVPRPGQVRDVFTHTLPGMFGAFGADPIAAVRVSDDRDATVRLLDAAGERLVVTTGGTAGSSTDHVRGALAAVGAKLVLDRVDVRPGRPMLLARRGDTLYLCLPGNPMAAMVGAVLFGEPLVAGLLGRAPRRTASVRLGTDVPNDRPGALVLAYRTEPGRPDAAVVPAARQTSAMLRGLADAEGLMLVPSGGARTGDLVPSVALPWW